MDNAFTLALGIDLGTSNSALALADAGSPARIIPLLQAAGPGVVEALSTLPSALYLPHADEFAVGAFTLPWSAGKDAPVVGRFARSRGALAPDRLVTSAKSWLCNPRIDRGAAVLPWQSESVPAAERVSPLDASTRYLEHLRAAAGQAEAFDWAATRVVITVPASFDEAARDLTREAARRAGFGEPLLLEEPLAAFYAWLETAGSEWRRHVRPGDVVLVCDVGGGTADFSLVAVGEADGALVLDRISVGEHILLGGDNLDLALAHALRAQLDEAGQAVDEWQFLALVQAAREAG
jgi:molecular chaperone DnaK (HSP70)